MAWHTGSLTLRKRELARLLLAHGDFPAALKILAGAVYGTGYDPEFFELLGQALLASGEAEKAGRFLFLSGARSAAYADAIALFLKRNHDPANFRQLHSRFPRRVQNLWKIAAFPNPVYRELVQLGFPEDIQQYFIAQRQRRLRVRHHPPL